MTATLTVDTSSVERARSLLDELSRLAEAPGALERFGCSFDALGELFEIPSADLDDGSASGATALTVRLEPTQRFLELLTALRAGDGGVGIGERIAHGSAAHGEE